MSQSPKRSEITLQDLAQHGLISSLTQAATQSVLRLSGETDERVAIALALAQTALSLGHLGLRLASIAEDFSPEIMRELRERELSELADEQLTIQLNQLADEAPLFEDWSNLPDLADWLACLKASPAVWSIGQTQKNCPFVLDGEVLFTLKAWRGESKVAHALYRLCLQEIGPIPQAQTLWTRLFADSEMSWFDGGAKWDRSKLALYSAFRGSLMVIHGGPGTGKTTLTQRILAALIEQYGQEDDPLRIAITAPTGKAAQRLTESIQSQASFFKLPDEIQAQLAELQGLTLHSLLGVAPGRRPEHHRMNPLPYDVVVVDECSMVDMWLMESLLEAIVSPADRINRSRLLLIGDPQQLPSVSAGAPFTELCGQRGSNMSQATLNDLQAFLSQAPTVESAQEQESAKKEILSALDMSLSASENKEASQSFVDRVVALNQVRRVSAESGIHAAATAIQDVAECGVDAVIRCFRDPHFTDTEYFAGPPFPSSLFAEVLKHAQETVSLAKIDPNEALQHLKNMCLLSPHYGGALGVNELNEAVESQLRQLRIGGWGRSYVGRPILITQNHPPTGLVNGDIGIVGLEQQVYFENRRHPVKLELLPPHRTVFAMSIHKSQGSEFKKVIMCIPPERSPIMTRELIYTGLTRAKKHAIVIGNLDVLSASIMAQVERGGQLSARLSKLL